MNPADSRRRLGGATRIMLVLAASLTGLALLIGISDNPLGIGLLYAAGIALVLAGTHRWRDPKRYGLLLVLSVVGFVLNVVIHNFSEVGAERIAHLPVLAGILGGISVVTFMIAVIVCPMGGLVGAVGGIVSALTRERSPA